MLEDVTVVVWGEFGRTPKINGNAGRDHWSRVMSVLLAGGGMKTGQVVGASDPKGGEPADRPVYLGEVMATLYQNLGIDASKQQLTDLSGLNSGIWWTTDLARSPNWSADAPFENE